VGIHSAAEALRVRPKKVREIWFREDFESAHQLRELAKQAEESGVPVKHRSGGQLDAIGSGHQGVALAVTENPEIDWEQLKGPEPRIILILDGIEDPHNLGSMLRTGWLTGVAGILIPDDRAVGLTPSVCKVASGGAEHVPVESFTNLPSAIQDLKNAGFWVYGLSEKGVRKPWEFKLPKKVAWIVGSEGGGMRITTERACDELVKIPQVESGSSYNAAVAMAMALAETCRQFGKPE
jgi:23S rRNA (guanosine2251-2'-O)-methyltransferase